MLDNVESEMVSKAIASGNAVKMQYVGEPALTRGDYGEMVCYGYNIDGYIYVWDSTFGWFLWSSIEDAPFRTL